MNTRLLPLLLAPVAFMCLRRYTGAYIFSALVTLSCLIIVCSARSPDWPLLALGLAFSIVGDWFLAHIGARQIRFIYGVGGFFLAHACFLAYSLKSARPGALSLVVLLALVAGYAILLWRGIYPNAKQPALRVALAAYMLISACVFSLSLSMQIGALPRALFCVGIFFIVFSDTLIGLSRFMNVGGVGAWILPTYYMCHVLITASALCVKT